MVAVVHQMTGRRARTAAQGQIDLYNLLIAAMSAVNIVCFVA